MPGDTEQEREPARVVAIARNQRRFIDHKGKITASAHRVILSAQEPRQVIKLCHEIRLKRTIAHKKRLAIISSSGESIECRDFIAIIFAPPVPN